jgi:hypothetical protein
VVHRTSKVAVICAMLATGCSDPRDPALAPPIAVASPDAPVVWGQASEVSGTQVMRVDLIRERSGGGSSGYAETISPRASSSQSIRTTRRRSRC